MATLEAPEFPFCHGHNEYTTIHGTILSERNPETCYVTPIHQMTEKISTMKGVGEADTLLP